MCIEDHAYFFSSLPNTSLILYLNFCVRLSLLSIVHTTYKLSLLYSDLFPLSLSPPTYLILLLSPLLSLCVTITLPNSLSFSFLPYLPSVIYSLQL